MLRDTIIRTARITALVVGAAMAMDYIVSILITNNPATYTPLTTLLISIVIAGPLAYFLTSQSQGLLKLQVELSSSLAAKQLAIEEAESRRVEAEDALTRLRESDRLYRLLADNLTDNVNLWSRSGERLYMSPSIVKLTGFTIGEYMDLPANANVSPEDYQRIVSVVRALVPGGEPGVVEYESVDKDGSVIWVKSTY